ncbi:MAG: peptidase [Candidatus Aminicenantes bacterium]|nr:peptidase [Candidatus Aminicenantes bacterium]
MSKKCLWLLVAFFAVFSCNHDSSVAEETWLQKLQKLPDVLVTEIAPPQGYAQAFQIDVGQPVDHNNPSGRKFYQRIYLSHLTADRPVVLSTRGYGISRNSLDELAILLDANQIVVTHRFFPNARPDPLDWQYLTIWQAANDHHRLVQMFKPLYAGNWLNEGVSKGGMTALYHRRFFPADVAATVAYVAPVMFGVEDPRFRPFLLEQVGSREAREKIMEFQRQLLASRQLLLPLLENYALNHNFFFPFGAEATLEYAVIEYIFAFWQYGDGDVSKIPAADATAEVLFDHLDAISGFSYYAQTNISYFEPFFYQAFTELGYCPYVYDHLRDLLFAVPRPTYRVFAPAGVALDFDAAVMIDVNSWLQDFGNNIIYIYGGNDPYTAAACALSGKTNALRMIQPGANHRVKIADLSERSMVLQRLGEWMEINLATSEKVWQKAAAANSEQAEISRREARLGF